jgi:hypothetical protein
MSRSASRDAVRTLLDLAQPAEPFCSDLGQPFFALPLATDARQAYPIRPDFLALYLTARYFHHCGEPPPDPALRSALRTLEARAFSERRTEPLYPRVGWRPHTFFGPTIFLNLANDDGEFIAINAEHWEIVGNSPACFAHHRAQLPLPRPPEPPRLASTPAEECLPDTPPDPAPAPVQPDPAAIARLRSFFPCDDPAWRRCLAWLIAALHPAISYPILILQGPPVSGKSTAARLLRALLDPSNAPLLDLPFSRRRIYSLAARQWITAFDYVTDIPRPAAGALCRISTGAEHLSQNCNYRDEPFLHHLRRPVLLTAPAELVIPPGLAAHALLASFPGIPPASRRSETELWEEFEQEAPRILGALCSAASIALKQLSEVYLAEPPACVDAARWAVAAAPALGVAAKDLLAAFQPFEPDPLAAALAEFMRNRTNWQGSASALLAELRPALGDAAPATPRAFSQRLRSLTHTGLAIEFGKSHGNRSIRVAQSMPKSPKFAPPDSPSPKGSRTYT